MGWCTATNLEDFLAAAGAYLRARPADNILLLAAAEELRAAAGDALFGWLEQGSQEQPSTVRGAFVHVPPKPVLLGGLAPEAAAVLANTLVRLPRQVRGVDAAAGAADAFAKAWTQRTGSAARVHYHTRVYRLTGPVTDHPGPPGGARIAASHDRDLVAAWFGEFSREVGDLSGTPDATADELIASSGVTLWETADGPVAMATVIGQVAGVARLSIVYTPPASRHHGYGSAALAAARSAALRGGAADVLMITDVSRPLTSSLRELLGCEPAGDRLVLSFDPGRAAAEADKTAGRSAAVAGWSARQSR
jgi:GNAT superfamily N-acetyltransferase